MHFLENLANDKSKFAFNLGRTLAWQPGPPLASQGDRYLWQRYYLCSVSCVARVMGEYWKQWRWLLLARILAFTCKSKDCKKQTVGWNVGSSLAAAICKWDEWIIDDQPTVCPPSWKCNTHRQHLLNGTLKFLKLSDCIKYYFVLWVFLSFLLLEIIQNIYWAFTPSLK